MMSLAANQFPLPWLVVFGLLLFLGVFLGMTAWVMRRSGVDYYRRASYLPFEKENRDGRE